MATTPDGADAEEDLNELYDWLLQFAKTQLAKHGEFLPFGATMDLKGKIQPAMAATGDERQESHDLMVLLSQRFREQARSKEIRAAAQCVDMRINEPERTPMRDAIMLLLEHRSGASLIVYYPYAKRESGHLEYGDAFTLTNSERNFFR